MFNGIGYLGCSLLEMVDDGGMIFFQDAADLGFCCNPLAEGNVAEVNACLDQVPFSACSQKFVNGNVMFDAHKN